MLDDVIRWVKFSGANWAADSQGFYYRGYEEPAKGSELSGQNQFQKVYYHKLGTPQSEDEIIYADPTHPLRYYDGFDDGDTGKYLFVSVSEGTSGTQLMYKRTGVREPFRIILKGFDHEYSVAKVRDNMLYLYTNEGAPNYHLLRMDVRFLPSPPERILPEDPNMFLQSVRFVGDYIFAIYMKDASSRVYQYTLDGKLVREVALPGIGTVAGFEGKDDATETFYTFSTFTAPPAIYRYDLTTGESTLFARPEVKFDPEDFVTEQVFFPSKDGTQVPMFLSYRKDLKKNGKNPVYLYGYGGFNAPLTPGFSPTNIAMMEQGAIYVSVNLRGGNEYGEAWHKAGMLTNKQNVFDDFIAAAEYLIAEGGSSDDPEQFEYIYKYSPLHNIKEGTCYPATMVTTGDHDDRVVPAHSFKFAATLQQVQGCDKPVLIRIDTNAGHGAGKPTAKRIAEAADILSFFFWNTDTDYRPMNE